MEEGMEANGNNAIFNETEVDTVGWAAPSITGLDYMNMSLDEIIKAQRDRMGNQNGDAKSGLVYGTDDTKGAQLTPVYLLKLLSEDGKAIEMEAKELQLENTNMTDFRAHRWRVIWTHAGLEGIGEAPRKMMATQVAAFDLLEKLRNQFPDYELPMCRIPLGCVVNPYLLILLENECEKLGVSPPEYHLKATTSFRDKTVYTALCFVEDEVFLGRSYDPHYAKRFACKKAYETMILQEYPDDKIFRGGRCLEGGTYNSVESEANHVYVMYERPAKRIRLSHPESSMAYSSAASSDIVIQPPPSGVPPPPIVLPKSLTGSPHSSVSGSQHLNAVQEPESMDQTSGEEEIDIFNTLEIEDPEKYGELSDDDDGNYGVGCVDNY